MTDLELKKKSRLSKLGQSKKAPTSNKPKTSRNTARFFGFQKNEALAPNINGSMLITYVNMAIERGHAATVTPCSAPHFTRPPQSLIMSSTTRNLIIESAANYCHQRFLKVLSALSESHLFCATFGASIKKKSDTASASPKAWSLKSSKQFQTYYETP